MACRPKKFWKKNFKKKVKIRKISIDRYKRVIGIVYKENLEINHFLVINGHAWCYERYSERPIIKIAESIAKEKDLEYGSLKKLFHHGNGEKIGNDNK